MISEEVTEVTNNIRISVLAKYLANRSDVDNSIYSFSYEVKINNLGKDTVQLLNRHWIVISGSKQCADVKGEGVVGESPIIEPGAEFKYSSWTQIFDVEGSMYGSYTFKNEGGEFFIVNIPRFYMFYLNPEVMH